MATERPPSKQPHFVEPPSDPSQRQKKEPYYGPEHWRKINLWAHAHQKELSPNDSHMYSECRATFQAAHLTAMLSISIPGVIFYGWYARRNGLSNRNMWQTAIGITIGSYFYGVYKASIARKDCIDALLQLDTPLGSIARQIVADGKTFDGVGSVPVTDHSSTPTFAPAVVPVAPVSTPPAPSAEPTVAPTRVTSWREWRRLHQHPSHMPAADKLQGSVASASDDSTPPKAS